MYKPMIDNEGLNGLMNRTVLGFIVAEWVLLSMPAIGGYVAFAAGLETVGFFFACGMYVLLYYKIRRDFIEDGVFEDK